MILRIISAVMFTLAGGLTGALKSANLRKKVFVCREIETMLDKIIFLIRYNSPDVYSICIELKKCGFEYIEFVEKLPEEFRCGEDFHAIWGSLAESDTLLNGEELETVKRTGTLIGTADTFSTLNSLEVIREELVLLRRSREEECAKKGRVYRSCGVLIGAMTGIMIL